MKKIYISFAAILVIAAMGAGGVATFLPAPDTTEPIWSSCNYGTTSGCDQLYTDTISAGVRYRRINAESTPTADRAATVQEIGIYQDHVKLTAIFTSQTNLSADVESGKKAVEILREWSTQAMAINASWDSLTDAQKDARMKELFRRNAIFWDKYADDLVTRGLGQ